MDDNELDHMLNQSVEALPPNLVEESRRLAKTTMPKPLRLGPKSRSIWLKPTAVALGGALLLTAGVGVTAYSMSHWAGFGLSMENVRSNEPIRLSWVTSTGDFQECRFYIELRNSEPGDITKLDSAILDKDWRGMGQELYDETEPALDPDEDGTNGQFRVSDAFQPELREFTESVFPGILWLGEGVIRRGHLDRVDESRGVDATGMTCAPEVAK